MFPGLRRRFWYFFPGRAPGRGIIGILRTKNRREAILKDLGFLCSLTFVFLMLFRILPSIVKSGARDTVGDFSLIAVIFSLAAFLDFILLSSRAAVKRDMNLRILVSGMILLPAFLSVCFPDVFDSCTDMIVRNPKRTCAIVLGILFPVLLLLVLPKRLRPAVLDGKNIDGLKRTAVHEAGHFLVWLGIPSKLKKGPGCVEIDVGNSGAASGVTKIGYVHPFLDGKMREGAPEETGIAHLFCCLAGGRAERIFFGDELAEGSAADIAVVEKIAAAIAGCRGIPFGRAWYESFVRDAIMRIDAYLYENREAVAHVANTLLEKGTVTGVPDMEIKGTKKLWKGFLEENDMSNDAK